jgi:hypothetical protein
MSRVTKMLPASYPRVQIAARAPAGQATTVRALCLLAGIECRVTGPAALRPVRLGHASALTAVREPGPAGVVWIGAPQMARRRRALHALGLLAYAVFDYAARESLRGLPEARPAAAGRPRKARVLSGAERQRRWRSRRREE